MARALVVYESLFGNSHRVADAVARGLAHRGVQVEVVRANEAAPDPEADLIVVGGPTHAFGMSRPSSRASRPSHLKTDEDRRRAEGEPGADAAFGVREWLDSLSPRSKPAAAAFDTRVKNPMPSRASRAMAKRLKHAGCSVIAPPEGFLVEGMTGPLSEGEVDRAVAWGEQLAELVTGHR